MWEPRGGNQLWEHPRICAPEVREYQRVSVFVLNKLCEIKNKTPRGKSLHHRYDEMNLQWTVWVVCLSRDNQRLCVSFSSKPGGQRAGFTGAHQINLVSNLRLLAATVAQDNKSVLYFCVSFSWMLTRLGKHP